MKYVKLNMRKKDKNIEKDIINEFKGETSITLKAYSKHYFSRIQPILQKLGLGFETDFISNYCFIETAYSRTESMDDQKYLKLNK